MVKIVWVDDRHFHFSLWFLPFVVGEQISSVLSFTQYHLREFVPRLCTNPFSLRIASWHSGEGTQPVFYCMTYGLEHSHWIRCGYMTQAEPIRFSFHAFWRFDNKSVSIITCILMSCRAIIFPALENSIVCLVKLWTPLLDSSSRVELTKITGKRSEGADTAIILWWSLWLKMVTDLC